MQIYKIYPRGFAANSYILTADGKNALVVDPAQSSIADELKKRGLCARYVLLTHAHFDHVGGVAVLRDAGAKALCSRAEELFIGTRGALLDCYGREGYSFTADETLTDGETRLLCGLSVTAIATPGHTAGGMCYLVSDGADEVKDGGRVLFTGDTLFEGSVGRTDLPTGDAAALRTSLKKLAALPGDIPVYPGHEEDTSLEKERRTNPFLIDA